MWREDDISRNKKDKPVVCDTYRRKSLLSLNKYADFKVDFMTISEWK